MIISGKLNTPQSEIENLKVSILSMNGRRIETAKIKILETKEETN